MDLQGLDSEEEPISEIKTRKFSTVKILALTPLLLIGITYASSIGLSTSNISEFGQGIVKITSCDSYVEILPKAGFTKFGYLKEVNGMRTLFTGDGFYATNFFVGDIANNCAGKQFVLNVYDSTSAVSLNSSPLLIDYVPNYGGFFLEEDPENGGVGVLNSYSIESATPGSGSFGSSADLGKSSFQFPLWPRLSFADGFIDIREISRITLQTREIPANSLAFQVGRYSALISGTLDDRDILVKGNNFIGEGRLDSFQANSVHEGKSIRQGFGVYLPIDISRSVTNLSYSFSNSQNLICTTDGFKSGVIWPYFCVPTANNWILDIGYSGP